MVFVAVTAGKDSKFRHVFNDHIDGRPVSQLLSRRAAPDVAPGTSVRWAVALDGAQLASERTWWNDNQRYHMRAMPPSPPASQTPDHPRPGSADLSAMQYTIQIDSLFVLSKATDCPTSYGRLTTVIARLIIGGVR